MASSPYGRAAIGWPDFGTDPGPALHGEVTAGVANLSNHLTGRWKTGTLINASGTMSFIHNFNLTLSNLRVRLYESGAELSEAQVAAGFTIAQVDANTISVTNTGVVGRTVELYVFPVIRNRKADLDPDLSALIKVLSTQGHADTASGTAVTLGAVSTSFKMLTAAGTLVSIAGIPVQTEHTVLLLTNETGTSLSILNENAGASASARILTGTGATLSLANNASLLLVYDVNTSRWRVVGGSGGGGYSNLAATLDNGTSIIGITSGFQKVRVQSGLTPVATLSTTPFGTTAPLDGTEVVLVGISSTNIVAITVADIAKGFVGNGDVELYKGSTLTVIYDAVLDRWIEKARCIISIA
jgi:hypothetical protein